MSGDVTAAIESLREWSEPDQPHSRRLAADVRSLLAEVERLRAEVESARARTRGAVADYEEQHRRADEAWAVADGLRAEREALHSDEMRDRLTNTIAARTNRPLHDAANREAVEHAVDGVLSVLSTGSETDPLIGCPHWEPGRITKRKGCTACAAEATQ